MKKENLVVPLRQYFILFKASQTNYATVTIVKTWEKTWENYKDYKPFVVQDLLGEKNILQF